MCPSHGKHKTLTFRPNQWLRVYWGLASWLLCGLMVPTMAWPPLWWQAVHGYDGSKPWNSYMTYTAAYFGPNAMPVFETLDGRTLKTHRIDVTSDVFWGFGDQTQSLSGQINYMLWPGRVVVSGWGTLLEHYKTTMAIRDIRASTVESGEQTFIIGDLYLSTQVRIFEEAKYRPDLMIEWVLKTASSNSSAGARNFDTPGYALRGAVGKSWIRPQAFVQELRLVGNVGFLSYQLNNHQQNDASSGALQVQLRRNHLSWSNEAAGYYGWTDKGDRPLVLRSKLTYGNGPLKYYVQYQHALHDYPFRRVQAGVGLDLYPKKKDR
jgi:hypothetical protein